MAAEARRNGSAYLEVCTPQEVQWKPPLRQAATTLQASGESVVEKVSRSENVVQFDKIAELRTVPTMKDKQTIHWKIAPYREESAYHLHVVGKPRECSGKRRERLNISDLSINYKK